MVLEVISQLCFHPFDVVGFKFFTKFHFYPKKWTMHLSTISKESLITIFVTLLVSLRSAWIWDIRFSLLGCALLTQTKRQAKMTGLTSYDWENSFRMHQCIKLVQFVSPGHSPDEFFFTEARFVLALRFLRNKLWNEQPLWWIMGTCNKV